MDETKSVTDSQNNHIQQTTWEVFQNWNLPIRTITIQKMFKML